MTNPTMVLHECDNDAQWDALVDASPQGTIFSMSAFLHAVPGRLRRFLISAAGKPLALCAGREDDSGEQLSGFPFAPYQGILFVSQPQQQQRQRIGDEFRISEFALAALTARYRRVSMALSWQFADMRPFLWLNYHAAQLGQFRVTPRYTAVLQLDGIDRASYPAQTRVSRRQELRKGADYLVREEQDVERFLDIYALTFARQGIEVDAAVLAQVRAITAAALAQGFGRLSSCSTADGIAAMTLFLFDRRRAYYLFAANHPDLRSSGAATRLMFDNIYDAKQRGLAEFDFVGVNSPNRGDFKLSFNPELRQYFEAVFERGADA